VKLVKYFYEREIPVVIKTDNKQNIPDVVRIMKVYNRNLVQVRHPRSIVKDEDKEKFKRAFESLGILSRVKKPLTIIVLSLIVTVDTCTMFWYTDNSTHS